MMEHHTDSNKQQRTPNETNCIEYTKDSRESNILSFENIFMDVISNSYNSKNRISLIKGISGKFESKKLTALMGPSGSCKTTFLNLLVGDVPCNSFTRGHILYNNKPRNQMQWASQICYVTQDDEILPGQSVYDFLLFSVRTKQSNKKAAVATIEGLIKDLSIQRIRDVRLEVVSGGERKRVMIAAALCLNTDIIILDEPTSGLDSSLALKLIIDIRRIAERHNKIVIMSIHQPGAGLFEMIDDLFFIYKGSLMYNGPTARIDEFFRQNEFTEFCNLSKPEFLFELFNDMTAFPKIVEYNKRVHQLHDEIVLEAQKQNEYDRFSKASDKYVDFSFSLRHMMLLCRRHLKLDLNNSKKAIVIWALFSFSFFLVVLKGTFIVNDSPSDVPNLLFGYYGELKLKGNSMILLKILKGVTTSVLREQSKYNNIDSTGSFGLFNARDVIDNMLPGFSFDYMLINCSFAYLALTFLYYFGFSPSTNKLVTMARKEMRMGAYSFVTLASSLLCIELAYGLVYVFITFAFLYAIGAGFILPNLHTVVAYFVSLIFIVVSSLTITALSSKSFVRAAVVVALFILHVFVNPEVMENIYLGGFDNRLTYAEKVFKAIYKFRHTMLLIPSFWIYHFSKGMQFALSLNYSMSQCPVDFKNIIASKIKESVGLTSIKEVSFENIFEAFENLFVTASSDGKMRKILLRQFLNKIKVAMHWQEGSYNTRSYKNFSWLFYKMRGCNAMWMALTVSCIPGLVNLLFMFWLRTTSYKRVTAFNK